MRNFFRFVVLPVIAVAVVANLKDLRKYLKLRAM